MSNALATLSRGSYMQQLRANLAWICGIGISGNADPQTKADRQQARFLNEPGNEGKPFVVQVTFKPDQLENGKYSFADINIAIPDPKGSGKMVLVPAKPYLVLDGNGGHLPYFALQPYKTTKGEDRYQYVEMAHWCMVMTPNGNDPFYKLVPIALATYALKRWNNIAKNKQAVAQPEDVAQAVFDWPVIEAWPHRLEVPALEMVGINTRRRKPAPDLRALDLYVQFTPKARQALNRENPERGEFSYGKVLGVQILDESRREDALRPQPNANGKYRQSVFRICRITERGQVYVMYVGDVGVAKISPQTVMHFEQGVALNGYQALGLELINVDPTTVQRLARQIAAMPFSSNPLFVYAQGAEMLVDDMTEREVSAILNALAADAARQLQRDVAETFKTHLDRYSTAQLPDMTDVVKGTTFNKVWFGPVGPDDVVAAWIANDLNCEFKLDAWLHRNLRKQVLVMIAKKADVEIPTQPDPEPEAQAPAQETAAEDKVPEDASPPEVPPAAEEAEGGAKDAEQPKPPTKKRGGRGKKAQEEQAAPPAV